MLKEYKNITVGVILFDFNFQKILLLKRREDKIYPGTLAFPGGKVQLGETFEQAAKRELFEEVGIENINLFFNDIYFSKAIMVCFVGQIKSELLPANNFYDYENLNSFELAPNVYKASISAFEQLQNISGSKNLINVEQSLKKAAKFIMDNHIQLDSLNGWDHYLLQKRIGIIGSSVGLISLYYAGIEKYNQIVIDTISTLQTKVQADGGWSTKTISSTGEQSITESTCYCMIAFYYFGISENEPIIKNAIDWLYANQHKSGGWGTNKISEKTRLTPTCLAIIALNNFFKNNQSIQQKLAIEWLKSIQNKDGGWGYTQNSQSTVAHTSYALICLTDYINSDDSIIIRGATWLLNNYSQKKLWEDDSELDYLYLSNGNSLRFEFKHPSHPLAVLALLKANISIENPILLNSIVSIIKIQDNLGFWSHSMTPGHVPIWASYGYMWALWYFKTNLVKYFDELMSINLKRQLSCEHFNKLLINSFQQNDLFITIEIEQENEESLKEQLIKKYNLIADKVKTLIAQNKTEDAISELLTLFKKQDNKSALNQIIMQSSFLNQLELQTNLNTIEPEQRRISIAKINNSILELVDNELIKRKNE